MKINNIYSRKDISHAGNIVEGIYKLVQNKTPCDVVIGSGNFVSIKEIINFFTKKLAINTKWIRNGKKNISSKSKKSEHFILLSV